MQCLTNREVRSVYIITYSQADTRRFTKESFARIVKETFEHNNTTVVQWVCSIESHRQGGSHFHIAVKLNKIKHWLGIRRDLSRQHGIEVNFCPDIMTTIVHGFILLKITTTSKVRTHPDLFSASVPNTSRALSQRHRNNNKENKKPRLTNIIITVSVG